MKNLETPFAKFMIEKHEEYSFLELNYWKFDFPNGYGAKVISHKVKSTTPYSYFSDSDDEHPYELAVLKDDDLYYRSEITNDVLGHLNQEEVCKYLQRIFEL